MPALILLFVAAGLLVLAGTGMGRVRGRPVSRDDAAVMAGMTGVAVAFLGTVMAVLPLLLFPVAIGAVLVATWTARRQWDQLGAFLIGGGGLVAAMEGLALANDLADPAVSIPGWTPIPLAAGCGHDHRDCHADCRPPRSHRARAARSRAIAMRTESLATWTVGAVSGALAGGSCRRGRAA